MCGILPQRSDAPGVHAAAIGPVRPRARARRGRSIGNSAGERRDAARTPALRLNCSIAPPAQSMSDRTPSHRASRHGRVLCVGRAPALSGAARQARGHRRRTTQGRRRGRRCAALPNAARIRRARRRDDRDLRGARPRRQLGDGPHEGGTRRARRDPAARGFRRVPALFEAVQGRGARRSLPRSRIAASTRSTSILPTSRPRRVCARARRRRLDVSRTRARTVDQGGGARRDRAVVVDRPRAEQAAREDRLRSRQAGRHHDRHRG